MLVISRKLHEKVYIGDNICVTVVDIDRGKIRLGIEAPDNVPIYRQELLPLRQPQPKRQGEAASMIEIPNGLALYADEFGKKWLVVGSDQRIARQRLSYADSKTPVPGDSDLIVEFEAGNQSAAEALAIRLRASDYSSVITRLVDKRHDVGGEA